MPKITAASKTFECVPGANLRNALLDQGINLYNGSASVINCHGFGTCGTCTVEVEGEVSPMGQREKLRLSLPPHSPQRQRRLSCQTQVMGDVKVTKYNGFWGQGSEVVWSSESQS